MAVGFLRWLHCMPCVAENAHSCAVDFPHSSPGFSPLPWGGFGSDGAPVPLCTAQQEGCPCSWKTGFEFSSALFMVFFSAISTFLGNFSERGMLKLVCCIRGSSMWEESCLCYMCGAFDKQPEPGAVGWGEHLLARCHLEAVEYSWMIMAFLPSAAIWQEQRNADLSQSEIKHGT